MSEAIFALLGTALGIIGSYIFGKKLIWHQRKMEAAAKFREAFVDEIAECKLNRNVTSKEISYKALQKHEKAIILFEPFLSKSEVYSLRKLWAKHCLNHQYPTMNDFSPQEGIGSEHDIKALTDEEQRKNTLDFYQNLIKFSNVDEKA